MPTETRATVGQDSDNGPRCVFCAAPWSAEMLRLYDAGANGASCSCCVIFPDFDGLDAEVAPEPRVHVELPKELCCEACGRVLYRLAGSQTPSPG